MKNSRSNNNMQSSSGNTKKPRPEVRDNLDSRKNKEGKTTNQKSNKGDTKKG
jgi:hypothetical protein